MINFDKYLRDSHIRFDNYQQTSSAPKNIVASSLSLLQRMKALMISFIAYPTSLLSSDGERWSCIAREAYSQFLEGRRFVVISPNSENLEEGDPSCYQMHNTSSVTSAVAKEAISPQSRGREAPQNTSLGSAQARQALPSRMVSEVISAETRKEMLDLLVSDNEPNLDSIEDLREYVLDLADSSPAVFNAFLDFMRQLSQKQSLFTARQTYAKIAISALKEISDEELKIPFLRAVASLGFGLVDPFRENVTFLKDFSKDNLVKALSVAKDYNDENDKMAIISAYKFVSDEAKIGRAIRLALEIVRDNPAREVLFANLLTSILFLNKADMQVSPLDKKSRDYMDVVSFQGCLYSNGDYYTIRSFEYVFAVDFITRGIREKYNQQVISSEQDVIRMIPLFDRSRLEALDIDQLGRFRDTLELVAPSVSELQKFYGEEYDGSSIRFVNQSIADLLVIFGTFRSEKVDLESIIAFLGDDVANENIVKGFLLGEHSKQTLKNALAIALNIKID